MNDIAAASVIVITRAGDEILVSAAIAAISGCVMECGAAHHGYVACTTSSRTWWVRIVFRRFAWPHHC
jgi:hypothetical protein